MGYREEVLADSPTVYFPMDNSSASTNLGSRSGVGVYSSNGYTFGTGKYGTAVNLSGSASHVFYTQSVNDYFNSGVWSLELWFKRADTTTSGYLELFNCYDSGSRNSITLYGSQGDQRLALWYNFKGGSRTKVIGPVVNDTNWHHVVIVSDGSNVHMYLDGAEVGTPGTAQTADYGSGILMLGAYETFANAENWIGSIDEFAVYKDKALSPARVAAHYSPPAPLPPVTIQAGTAGVLTFSGLLGPSLRLVSPPKSVMAGAAGTLTLRGLEGPTLNVAVYVGPPKAVEAGTAGTLYLNELGSTLVLSGPVAWESTGQWSFEVVMADKSMDATNTTASLEVRNSQKRLRPELKTLVRA